MAVANIALHSRGSAMGMRSDEQMTVSRRHNGRLLPAIGVLVSGTEITVEGRVE